MKFEFMLSCKRKKLLRDSEKTTSWKLVPGPFAPAKK